MQGWSWNVTSVFPASRSLFHAPAKAGASDQWRVAKVLAAASQLSACLSRSSPAVGGLAADSLQASGLRVQKYENSPFILRTRSAQTQM